MIRIMSTLLEEYFADEELTRRDLDETTLKGQVRIAAELSVL